MSFELNRGQAPRSTRFLARTRGGTLSLSPGEAVLSLPAAADGRAGAPIPAHRSGSTTVVRMRLVDADLHASMKGAERLPGTVNYFIGDDPSGWKTGIPTFGKIRCGGVYPGIDLVYYGHTATPADPASELEYDFVVAPGGDPGRIRLAFDRQGTGGPVPARVDAGGDLVLTSAGGELRHRKPVVYQSIGGERRLVAAAYRPLPGGGIGFRVGDYDTRRPLVIDPTLVYSTYVGGAGDDYGYSIAVDPSGEAVIAGTTTSTNLPQQGGVQGLPAGGTDVFVTKLNAAGTAALYSTYLGGTGDDSSVFSRMGVALDSAGAAYVVGFTNSKADPNNPAVKPFPTTPGAFQRTTPGFGETFVSKLSADGTSLVYSTLLGGSGWDYGNSIAVDATGNACICGGTGSDDFPTTANAYDRTFGGALTDVFVTRLNATGSGLLYSSYFGGSGNDDGNAITLDAAGNIYITGGTSSVDDPSTAGVNEGFPTTPGVYQSTAAGGYDAFICKIDPTASGAASLVFSSRFGGTSNENINHDGGIGLDPSGNIYICGTTSSTDLPVLNAFQAVKVGTWDAFVTKFDPNCTTLLWSTHLGASLGTEGNAIAVDGSGNAFVTGQAFGDNLPLVSPLQTYSGGGGDAYLSEFSSAGSLVFSTYLGGSGDENTSFRGFGAVRLDGAGGVYLTGCTHSGDMAVQSAFQGSSGGGWDAYVAKLSVGLPIPRPTNLQATAVSNSQINLTWIDNSSNETAFEVQRKTGNGSFVTVATTVANATSYPDTGLNGGTTYTYQVRAVRSGASSLFSDPASATTPANPPGDPSNLTAAAQSATSVSLNWQDHSNSETGFRIERKTGAGFFAEIASTPANATSYVDNTTAGSTAYTYRVRAAVSGGFSGYSNEAAVTTPPAVPGAPASLVATAVSSSQINLSWSDNSTNEDSFELERKSGTGTFALLVALGPNVTAFSDTGLTAATTYSYRIRAANAGGESGYSNTASATTQQAAASPPSAPSGLSASPVSAFRIDLTWIDNSSNETAFKLERMPAGGNFSVIAQMAANTTSYSDSGVLPNSTYTYRVRATNSAGDSANSNTASATTPLEVVPAPSGLAAAVVSNSRIDLTWSDNSSNETAFVVERHTDGNPFGVVATTAANVTGYQDNGLAPDTSYTYRVKAVNATSASDYAGPVTGHTLPPPPAVPTGLAAQAVSSTQIDVRWSDNSDNETGFDVERRTGNAGYVSAGSVGANGTLFHDTGLNPATTYTYRVRAHNAGGVSGPSGEASATTLNNAPGGPTNLQAQLFNRVYVSLSWTDGDPNVTGFKMERRPADGVYTEIGTTPFGTTSFTDGPLAAGSTYFYRVRATNNGADSGYSSEVKVDTVPDPPAPPSDLSATLTFGGTVSLTWTDHGANEDSVHVERRIGTAGYLDIATVSPGQGTYIDANVSAGLTYTYRLRAFNTGGASGYSNTASVILPIAPAPPAGLQITAFGDTSVTLQWTAGGGGPTSFAIQRKQGVGSYTDVGTVDAPTATFTDAPLTAGTTYSYRVRAHNAIGDSAPSNEVTVTTSRGALSVSPLQINFGQVRLGATGTRSVVLRNRDRTESLRVTVGAPASPWGVSVGSGTRVIPPRGQVTLVVTFRPTGPGAANGSLVITSSDPAHATATVKLSGRGR